MVDAEEVLVRLWIHWRTERVKGWNSGYPDFSEKLDILIRLFALRGALLFCVS